MDKRSLMGIILIGIIVTVWMVFVSVQQKDTTKKPAKPGTESTTFTQDTGETPQEKPSGTPEPKTTPKNIPVDTLNTYGEYFSKFTKGEDEIIRIETDLVIAVFSKKGAVLKSWTLKNYKSWNGYPSQLIREKKGELYLVFYTIDNKKIDSRDLYFTFDEEYESSYRISGNDSLVISARLTLGKDTTIIKRFTFYGSQYLLGAEIELNNLETILPARGYNDFIWSGGLKYQEKSSVDESGKTVGIVTVADEPVRKDAKDKDSTYSFTGITDYAAIKTKYFGVALVPQPYKDFYGTVELFSAKKQYLGNSGILEKYSIIYRVPVKNNQLRQSWHIYVGPMDYDKLSVYHLNKMVDFGADFFIPYIGEYFISPIAEYLIMPLFRFIHSIVPSYGITLIFFSIIMRIILYPLSIQQMRSAQKMKLLQPEIQRIREQYKDEQQTQQKETMKLYSEYGINPAGGCLPLVLQIPILFAIWAVLSSALELRQTNFILWITDLSQPDVLVTLPYSFLGIKYISGLALLMGITMFIQQKISVTDPRQKAMIYMMPIMFTLMFSSLPSGLNLYYFMFNLMSILQQVYINKFSKKKLTLADLKRSPKKEGWLQKKMREAQDVAASQGRSVPGQPYDDGKPHPTKKKRPPRKKR